MRRFQFHHPVFLFLSLLVFPETGLPRGEAVPDSAAARVQTGRLTLRFRERHPLGRQDILLQRYGETEGTELYGVPLKEYRLEWETFSAYVPLTYDGSEAYGLFVWVSPGNRGGPPPAYEDFLNRHRLIWIGGDGIGNERVISDRIAITMDGMHNMMLGYNIDPERIYIGGYSGGGRTVSEMAFLYPDVFTGAFYMMGCNFYCDLTIFVEGRRGVMPGFSPRLEESLLRQARNNRYVFLTAEDDFNRTGTQLVLKAYQSEGVKFAAYIEIPDWGHRLIPAEWFESAVEALDRPLRLCREREDTMDDSPEPDVGGIVRMGEERPVEAILHLRKIGERMQDRGKRREIREAWKTLLKDQYVKELYELVVEVQSFHDSLCRRGTTLRTTDTVLELSSRIEAFLGSGPSEALASEARRWLEHL